MTGRSDMDNGNRHPNKEKRRAKRDSARGVWLVRAGPEGEWWKQYWNDGVVSISFDYLKEPSDEELAEVPNREAFRTWQMQNKAEKYTKQKITRGSNQLWNFINELRVGDQVVMPQDRGSGLVAVGLVSGEYYVDQEKDKDPPRRRKVDWLERDVPLVLKLRVTVKRLHGDTAKRITHLVDDILSNRSGDEAGVTGEDGLVVEGVSTTASVLRYERDSKARKQCIEKHGTTCKVCGIDFGITYGELGKGFIHVHHIVPLAQAARDGQYRLDPENDLVPVCPNCHAMLHRHSDKPCTIETLRSIIRLDR